MLRKNIGTYQAINIALNSCKEFDYFTIHGSDDLMLPDKLEKHISSIQKENSLASISGYHRVNLSDDRILYSMKSGESMIVYNKSVFEELGYYDNTRFGGDTEYFERFKLKFGEDKLSKIDDKLSKCYITGNNISIVKFPLNSEPRKNYVKKYKTEQNKMALGSSFFRNFTRKKVIVFLSCTYKRIEISKIFKKKIIELQDSFEDDFDFINIIVDSEWSNSDIFQNESKFLYINHDNSPLSDKWNSGLDFLKNMVYDNLVIIGSDDVIHQNVFKVYKNKINENYDFIGIEDLYLFDIDSKVMYYWPGYGENNPRNGETIGLGRCLSKRVIEKLNYQLWNPGLMRNLDGSMMSKIKESKLNLNSYTFKCKEFGPCVDIKSDQNLTNINRFRNLEITDQNFEI
jgi:hypothetical protein